MATATATETTAAKSTHQSQRLLPAQSRPYTHLCDSR